MDKNNKLVFKKLDIGEVLCTKRFKYKKMEKIIESTFIQIFPELESCGIISDFHAVLSFNVNVPHDFIDGQIKVFDKKENDKLLISEQAKDALLEFILSSFIGAAKYNSNEFKTSYEILWDMIYDFNDFENDKNHIKVPIDLEYFVNKLFGQKNIKVIAEYNTLKLAFTINLSD